MVNGIQGISNVNVQMMTEMRERMFARLDADGDGQIDLAQIKSTAQNEDQSDKHVTRLLEDLAAADADGDGMVTREEFEQMPLPPPPPPPPSEGGDELFSRLDTDGDGQIDLAELQAMTDEADGADSRFSDLLEQLTAADINGDGIVSREEFDQIAQSLAPRGRSDGSESWLYTRDTSADSAADRVGTLVDQRG